LITQPGSADAAGRAGMDVGVIWLTLYMYGLWIVFLSCQNAAAPKVEMIYLHAPDTAGYHKYVNSRGHYKQASRILRINPDDFSYP